MKNRAYLATAFLAVSNFLMPFVASANNDNRPAHAVSNDVQPAVLKMSVNDFNQQNRDQQAQYLQNAVDKIVTDVALSNPALSQAIHDYFYVQAPDKPGAPGMIAFVAELIAVEDMAKEGKADLNKVQIERILVDLIRTDVLPKMNKSNPPPAPTQP